MRTQDLLGQQIVIPIAANNGDFAINALDNLGGSEGLISLRGRGLIDRPFEVVRAMEQEAEYKYRAKEQELLSGSTRPRPRSAVSRRRSRRAA